MSTTGHTCTRGREKGGQVATWKQALRAELAHSTGRQYAQVLLDLVKAFERVPFAVLVREAKELGYNLVLLRLSIATYCLGRVVRVDGVAAAVAWPTRGIVAGSVFATAELKLRMLGARVLAHSLFCCGHVGASPIWFGCSLPQFCPFLANLEVGLTLVRGLTQA